MAASSSVRYQSQLKHYPVLTIHISVTRNPERLHVVDAAKKLARFKEEPFTAFVLHALANEVRRFESELAQGPVADRVKYHDLLELEALALLTDEEKKECGL